jgi:chromosomal replication initiation ATPase DnaA
MNTLTIEQQQTVRSAADFLKSLRAELRATLKVINDAAVKANQVIAPTPKSAVPLAVQIAMQGTDVTKRDVFSDCRLDDVAWARFHAFWLLREAMPLHLRRLSLTAIGNKFGKDHGTVLHGVVSVKNRREVDATYRKHTDALREKFQAALAD